MVPSQPNPNLIKNPALRVIGEVLSHLLNVPLLSGALVTFVFLNLPTDLPNRTGGFGWALVFISNILSKNPRIMAGMHGSVAHPEGCAYTLFNS